MNNKFITKSYLLDNLKLFKTKILNPLFDSKLDKNQSSADKDKVLYITNDGSIGSKPMNVTKVYKPSDFTLEKTGTTLSNFMVAKRDGFVICNFRVDNLTLTGGATENIITVPEELKPKSFAIVNGFGMDSSQNIVQIKMYLDPSGGNIYAFGGHLTGGILWVNFSYFTNEVQ